MLILGCPAPLRTVIAFNYHPTFMSVAWLFCASEGAAGIGQPREGKAGLLGCDGARNPGHYRIQR